MSLNFLKYRRKAFSQFKTDGSNGSIQPDGGLGTGYDYWDDIHHNIGIKGSSGNDGYQGDDWLGNAWYDIFGTTPFWKNSDGSSKNFLGSIGEALGIPSGTSSSSSGSSSGSLNIWSELASWLHSMTGAELTGAQKEQNAFNAEQAAIQRDYETHMSNTAYQRSVADMQAAGLNPALMYGNGSSSSTPQGSSASGSAGSPDASAIFNMLLGLKQLEFQSKVAQQNIGIEQYRAETERLVGSAQAKNLDTTTDWIDRLNGLEEEARKLGNQMSEERIKQIQQEQEESKQRVKNLIVEAKTEQEKILLTRTQEAFYRAQARSIEEMLPYEQALREAQTDSQKAQAESAFVKAAYDRKLITSGMIESTVRLNNASADQNDIDRLIHEYEYQLSTGNLEFTDSDGNVRTDKTAKFVSKLVGALRTLKNALR